MQGRSLEGAGQEYSRGRVEAGAGKLQGRRKAEAAEEQVSSKAGFAHLLNFISIVLKTKKRLALIFWSGTSNNNRRILTCSMLFLAQ